LLLIVIARKLHYFKQAFPYYKNYKDINIKATAFKNYTLAIKRFQSQWRSGIRILNPWVLLLFFFKTKQYRYRPFGSILPYRNFPTFQEKQKTVLFLLFWFGRPVIYFISIINQCGWHDFAAILLELFSAILQLLRFSQFHNPVSANIF